MIGMMRGIVDDFNLRAVHAKQTVGLVFEPVEAQSVDYVDLLVPGLAMAIAQSAAFGVAFSLVAWRQKGVLRRLRLTPSHSPSSRARESSSTSSSRSCRP